MADTEKITINLSVVDLGQIDLLVRQGLYANRTDLIRTAIRNQIDRHGDVLQQTIIRRTLAVGVIVYTRSELEKHQARGEQVEIRALGMVVIQNDVPPDLARQTVKSIEVFGILSASDAVKEALADRIK